MVCIRENRLRSQRNSPIKNFAVLVVCTYLSFFLASARAETIVVSLADLNQALEQASSHRDAVSRLVLEKLSAELESAELNFQNGSLLYQESASNVTVEDGCNRTVILRMQTVVKALEDTSLSLTLDSLYDPISVTLNLHADVSAIGRARQTWGIRIHDCEDIARDSFNFQATGSLSAGISATLALNPRWTSDSTLSFFPTVKVEGQLNTFSPFINIDDSIFRRILEEYLLSEIKDAFSSDTLGEALLELQDSLQQDLDESLENGRIDVKLPPADDAQMLALYQLLQPESRFPLTLDMLYEHRQLILGALILGDLDAIEDIIESALVCQASTALQIALPHRDVYSLDSGNCETIDFHERRTIESVIGKIYYTNSTCTDEFTYTSSSLSSYCDVALDSARLGNPASKPDEIGHWVLSDGSTFDIGALSIEGLTQPFVQRLNYRTIETSRGLCELEMRVYATNPNARDNKSIMAFHGGSWQRRGSGALGIDATATHFTNRGFTVFAPFYRLVGDSDAVDACNEATLDDVIEDAHFAMDWVLQNQTRFGASGKPLLFGQSAGGHLAMSLTASRLGEIERSVLYYAPTDFGDFVEQINSGAYDNPAGVRILDTITGTPVSNLNADSTIVKKNSFPVQIASNPDQFPPVFLLHGELDTLLPFRQSSRLCNAYAASTDLQSGPAPFIPNVDSLARSYSCGDDGSQLHLIAEGEHALDLCVARGLCLSGNAASAREVARSVETMLDWAAASDVALFSDERGESAGGRMSNWFLIWLALYAGASVKFRSQCLAPQNLRIRSSSASNS